MATVFAEWDGHRRGLRDTPATIQDLTSAVRTAYGWSTEPLLKFSVRLLPPEQTALSESRRGAAGAAFQAFAPARVEAFAPAQCSALSLIMSTSRHTGSVAASVAVSPQPLTSITRRDLLATAPLIAAGAGALLAPPAALASFSIGESLQFIPEGGFQSEGAMQWPAQLAPDAVLPVGNACMPAVGFGV